MRLLGFLILIRYISPAQHELGASKNVVKKLAAWRHFDVLMGETMVNRWIQRSCSLVFPFFTQSQTVSRSLDASGQTFLSERLKAKYIVH